MTRRPDNTFLWLRIVTAAITVAIGLALVARGETLIGVLFIVLALLRVSMAVKRHGRRREWQDRRQWQGRLPRRWD